jgi:serine/threonine protein kinase
VSDEGETKGTPAPATARSPIADLAGRQLLHFKIVERLGAGGMGVVYRAFDTKLRRDVAIKALSARYLADDRNKELIFREARSAAAVSHPNIAAIYEVHDLDEAAFLVMELVDGETLRARLARGAVTRDEAMRIAREIARGLARAHEHGIVHRDLKPDNVMLARDGHVKLLDFGLAKVAVEAEPVAKGAADATGTTLAAGTRGRVMGTPGYMSPEQARGQLVDARTDVYAFGVVLYELFAGSAPFAHRSTTPEEWTDEAWQARPPFKGPREIAAIVARCLAVDPGERYRNGGELVVALAPRASHRVALFAASAVLVTIIVATVVLARGTHTDQPPPSIFQSASATQLTFSGDPSLPDLSPDGRYLAYATGWLADRILVRDLQTGATRQVSQGNSVVAIRWSPDGRRLLAIGGFDTLLVIDPEAGRVRQTDACGAATWSPDSRELVMFCVDRLVFVEATTFTRRSVSVQALRSAQVADWSAAGRLLLYASRPNRRIVIYTMLPDGSDVQRAFEDHDAFTMQWGGNGDRIYLERDRGQITQIVSIPYPALAPQDVVFERPHVGQHVAEGFTVSRDGHALIYPRSTLLTNLVEISRDGATKPLTADSQVKAGMQLSPDGSHIAFAAGTNDAKQVFVLSRSGVGEIRAVGEVANIISLAWSPDGKQIAYAAPESQAISIVDVASGQTRKLPASALGGYLAWAPNPQILFAKPGVLGVAAIDPITGHEHGIPLDLTKLGAGFAFLDGAYLIGRGDQIRLLTIANSNVTTLHTTTPFLGMSRDGAWVYALDDNGGRTLVYAIKTDGSGEARSVLSAHVTAEQGQVLPHESGAVLLQNEWRSELWMVSTESTTLRLPTPTLGTIHASRPIISAATDPIGFDDASPGGLPAGWTSSGGNAVVERDGARTVIRLDPGSSLIRRIAADMYRGYAYRLHVVSRGATGRIAGLVGSEASEITLAHSSLGDSTWQTHELLVEIPPDADYIAIAAYAFGDAPVWITELRFERSRAE